MCFLRSLFLFLVLSIYPFFFKRNLCFSKNSFVNETFSTADRIPVALIKSNKFRIKRIILDPGHGGRDPGAQGSHFKEKDITLAIGILLKERLLKKYPELKIILTRDRDKFIDLDERASLANKKKADLFISIHCNANGNSAAKGPEVYAIGVNSSPENLKIAERENSVILLEPNYEKKYEGFNPNYPESYIIFSLLQDYTINQSLRLASKIEKSIHIHKEDSRGIKQAGFLVLRRNTVPSILLETGFITNKKEENELGSREGQVRLVNDILNGYEKYRKSVED